MITNDNSDWKSESTPVPTQPQESDWKAQSVPVQADTPDWKSQSVSVSGSTAGTPAATSPTYTAVKKEIEDRHWWDSPALGAEVIKPEEIEAIALKHGVDPKELGEMTALLGGRRTEGEVFSMEELKRAFGATGRNLLGNLPQKLWKMTKPENMARAMDDIQSLAAARGSYAEMASNFIGPGGALKKGVAVAQTAPKAAALMTMRNGAVMGALFGFGGSETGHEVAGTTIGAVAGGVLGYAIPKTVEKVKSSINEKAAEGVVKAVDNALRDTGVIDRVTERYEANLKGEDVLRSIVTDTKLQVKNTKQIVSSLSQDQVKTLADLSRGTGMAVDDKITKRVKRLAGVADPEAEDLARAVSLVKETRKALSKDLNAQAYKGLDEAIEREGAAFVNERVSGLRKSRYLTDALMAQADGEEKVVLSTATKVLNYLADARYVTDAIDRRFGTEITPLLDKASGSYNAYTFKVSDAFHKIKAAVKGGDGELNYASLSPESKEKIYKWLDTGIGELTEEEQQVANRFASLGHDFLRDAQESGYKIKERGKYVPHQRINDIDGIQKTRDRLAEHPVDTDGKVSIDQIDQDTLRGVEIYSGVSKIQTQEQLDKAIEVLYMSRRDAVKLRRVGKAIPAAGRERIEGGGIPDYLREKDLTSLYRRWAEGTNKHIYLRQDLGALRDYASSIKTVSPDLGRYLTNLAQDASGGRHDTVAAWGKAVADDVSLWAAERKAQSTNPATKAAYSIIGNLDSLMRGASSNMYSYYLGARPDKALRNAMSPLFQTAPSMSPTDTRDATQRVLIAYGKAMANAKNAARELGERGLVPSSRMYEATAHIKGGIEDTPLKQMGRDVVDGAARASMFLYQSADTLTRETTRHVAMSVVEDALKGNEVALRHLAAVSPGYRKAISRAFQLQDKGLAQEEITKLYTNYLNGFTQFNYNKMSMSEFGRAMGWMFSMFSKWPATFVGDVGFSAQRIAQGRTMPDEARYLINKYMAPYLMLGTAQHFLWDKDTQEEYPVLQSVIGKDLTKVTAMDTPMSLFGEDRSKLPPMISGAWETGVNAAKLIKGDSNLQSVIQPIADSALSMFPAGGYLRDMLDTVPRIVTGEPIVPISGRELGKSLQEEVSELTD